MRVILTVLSLVSLSSVSFGADSKWGKSLWYEFNDGKGSLLITGSPAEEIFGSLATPGKLVQVDVDFKALHKAGRNVSCYKRTDTSEVQCVISVNDVRTGEVR